MRPALPLCLALSVGLLASCVDTGSHYPSLLPRPVEQQSVFEPAPRPSPTSAPDPALDAQLAESKRRADSAAAAFAKAADEAEAKVAVARGLAPGSEGWLNAQVALAALDRAREPLTGIQSDLERLAGDRALSGQPPYPALDAALSEARARTEQAVARANTIENALSH